MEDLTEDEHNTLQYAAGYVPKKFIEKFMKSTYTQPHIQYYVACLELLCEGQWKYNVANETFLEYTKRWLKSIDCEGTCIK